MARQFRLLAVVNPHLAVHVERHSPFPRWRLLADPELGQFRIPTGGAAQFCTYRSRPMASSAGKASNTPPCGMSRAASNPTGAAWSMPMAAATRSTERVVA